MSRIPHCSQYKLTRQGRTTTGRNSPTKPRTTETGHSRTPEGILPQLLNMYGHLAQFTEIMVQNVNFSDNLLRYNSLRRHALSSAPRVKDQAPRNAAHNMFTPPCRSPQSSVDGGFRIVLCYPLPQGSRHCSRYVLPFEKEVWFNATILPPTCFQYKRQGQPGLLTDEHLRTFYLRSFEHARPLCPGAWDERKL